MLSMGIILAVMSVAVEMFFVIQYEGLRNFMIRHEKFGLFFSFALSFFIGEMFGAHGVIALFAGMTSTVITIVIYRSHALHLVDVYRARQDEISAKIKNVLDVSLKTLVLFWKIITAPVRAMLWTKAKYISAKTSVSNAHSKVRGVFSH